MRNARSVAPIVLAWILQGTGATPGSAQDLVSDALRRFREIAPVASVHQLRQMLPPPVTPEFQAAALGSLSGLREIRNLALREQDKLDALLPALSLHDRQTVYRVKLVAVPDATIGLYARSAILISWHALSLLTADQLQAVVAHEIAHEYFWEEALRAVAHRDRHGLREIELLCDGVALLSLRELGTNLSNLMTAISAVDRFNREVSSDGANPVYHPTLSERRRFANAVVSHILQSSRHPAEAPLVNPVRTAPLPFEGAHVP